MSPRQIAAFLHFADRRKAHEEAASIITQRLAAHGDEKTLKKHLKGLTRT